MNEDIIECKKENAITAKNPDRLVFVNGNKIKLQGLTLQLISRIRDEAHRFARRYHHLLVTKNLLS